MAWICRAMILLLGIVPTAAADPAAIYSSKDRIHPVYGVRGMVAT